MKKLIPIFISVILMAGNIMPSFAGENILRSVDVVGNSEGYTIKIASSNAARISKTILSSNRVIINLKNLTIADNVITKYNGNKFVDNVMIEPCGENDTNILIQGDNVACSTVEFVAPTKIGQIQDEVASTISSVNELGSTLPTNRALQFGILAIFGIIIIGEVKFIKRKYKELQEEKEYMKKDIERTSEFKNHMHGFGNAGINKPYTTPIYTTPNNTALVRANYLKGLPTNETQTLNELLHVQNSEQELINKVATKKIIFGALSNINKDLFEKNDISTISNPIKTNMNTIVQELKKQTKQYTSNVISEKTDFIQQRLNKLY